MMNMKMIMNQLKRKKLIKIINLKNQLKLKNLKKIKNQRKIAVTNKLLKLFDSSLNLTLIRRINIIKIRKIINF